MPNYAPPEDTVNYIDLPPGEEITVDIEDNVPFKEGKAVRLSEGNTWSQVLQLCFIGRDPHCSYMNVPKGDRPNQTTTVNSPAFFNVGDSHIFDFSADDKVVVTLIEKEGTEAKFKLRRTRGKDTAPTDVKGTKMPAWLRSLIGR